MRSTKPARRRFTASDLVALLRAAPKPDPEYCDLIEAITRDQPVVQPSAWGS